MNISRLRIVSADIVAGLRVPISLAMLLGGGHHTLMELLGGVAVPELVLYAHPGPLRHAQRGRGRRVAGAELEQTTVGEPIAGPDNAPVGSVLYEIRVPTGDLTWLWLFDQRMFGSGRVEAVFTPRRSCIGVVLATSLALGAALSSGGDFVDINIMMLGPPGATAQEFLGRTRLPDPGTGFIEQCERYMRQFTNLGGWPPDVSMPWTRDPP